MSSETYKFAEFTLNPAKRTLLQESTEVKLRDKDFEVLLFLLENAPNLCSLNEIIKAVWGETNVENGSVEKAIANIRKNLADDARDPRFIKTVRTKGYIFVGDVKRVKEGPSEESVNRPEHYQPEKIQPKDLTHPASLPRNQRFRKALLGSLIALIVVGGFRLAGAYIWMGIRGEVVFADDFSDEAINSGRWKTKGKSVKLTGGIIKLSADETDNPGVLRSEFFSIDPTKIITIESRIRVTFSQNMKDEVYFGGLFGIVPKTTELERVSILEDSAEIHSVFTGVRYMNYDSTESYKDTSGLEYQDIKTEGFFLVRKGGRPNIKTEYAAGKISERIQPVWGKWFEQKLVYNPANGLMTYFIDGEKRGEFFVDRLQARDSQIRFEIIPWGWWVNHIMEMDYVRVTQ